MISAPPSAHSRNSLLSAFRSWLTLKNYSESTVRNYLSDTNNYFDFIAQQSLPLDSLYLPSTISQYLRPIQSDPNYRRYLSSLSKFFQFSLDQNLVSTNPIKAALKPIKPSTEDIITEYNAFLVKKHFSPTTIRNYLADIRQFIDWSKS